MEHEDRPLVGRQPAEPTFEQVPVGDGEQFVGCGRSIDRQHPKVRGPATLARRLGDADVDEEALEPRIEAVRIAEAPQVTPGDHQRVLEGILGPIDVAEDPLGDREEPVAPGADQVDIRLPIPVLRRLDEIAIHGSSPPRSRPSGAPSDSTGRSRGPRRSFFAAIAPVSSRSSSAIAGAEGGMPRRLYPLVRLRPSRGPRPVRRSATARRRSRRSRSGTSATRPWWPRYLRAVAAREPRAGLRRAARCC